MAAVNSAISAFYYLMLVVMPILRDTTTRSESVTPAPTVWPRFAAVCVAALLVVLPLLSGRLMAWADQVTPPDALARGVSDTGSE